jgi:hypothetical protein
MKLWFQLVLTVGIISVSAASLAYTWQTWRDFQQETRSEEICKYYIEQHAKDSGDVEKWLARRQCVNGVLGKVNLSTP